MADDQEEPGKTAGAARDNGVPVKISRPTQEAVRQLAVLFDESQQKFVSRLLTYFVENNGKEIEAKTQEFVSRTSAIVKGLPKQPEE